MEDRRLGRAIRLVRRRRRWRQADVAVAASVSQPWISRLEAGHVEEFAVGTLRTMLRALDASLVLSVSWHGAELDRLLDERRAGLVEACVRLLRRLGWQTDVEVSYSRYGERGSIDILAESPAAGAALVVEVKSELVAIEGTLRPLDAKARLAPAIVFDRSGWRPQVIGRLLVLPDSSTARRRVSAHAATLDAALPARGRHLTRWLRRPVGPFAGLVFLSGIHPTDGRRVVSRFGGASASSPASPKRASPDPASIGGAQRRPRSAR